MPQSNIERFQEATEEVASFLKSRMSGNIRVKVNTHTDPDGVSAGALFAKCLRHYDIPFHISFGGPPDSQSLEELQNQDYDLFVFLDQGTGQFSMIEEYILENDETVLILDHHPGEFLDQPDLTHLNPHSFGLDGTKDVSASGVVYSVLEKLDGDFKPSPILALIGALGDRQNYPSGFVKINQDIVEQTMEEGDLNSREGLKLNGRNLPLSECLSRSIRPFLLGLSGNKESSQQLIEDMGFDPERSLEDLDSEEEKELRDEILNRVEVPSEENLKNSLWAPLYTSESDRMSGKNALYEYVTILDACEKLKKEEVGFSALLGDEDSWEEALDCLHKYQNSMVDVINWIISEEKRMKVTQGMRYIDAGEEIETKMMSEALSICLESGIIEPNRPIIGMTSVGEDKLKASARASSNSMSTDKHIGNIFGEVTKELGGDGGGHKTAAGAYLPRERKEEFLEKVDQLLEEGD